VRPRGEVEDVGSGPVLGGLAGPREREQAGGAEGVCLCLSASCQRLDHVIDSRDVH
jgi:hypothetical protein